MKRGIFITMEGIDGCGKTTQTDRLFDYLEGNYNVVRTKEPGGGGEISETIRELLLSSGNEMTALTELFLIEASRSEHFNNTVIPSLENGKIVISERGCDSTVAYQGYAGGVNCDTIIFFNNIASRNILPDLTILFDMDPELSCSRIKGGNISLYDRIEKQGVDFQKKVMNGFLRIAEKNPDRIKIVEVNNKPEDVIFGEVINIVNSRLSF